MLRIWLFGVVRFEVDGVQVAPPSSRRARQLLAMLAVDRRPHSREALASRLWPDVLDESARASLRTALTQLRAAFGPNAGRFVLATREHVTLAGTDEVWVDVGEFERLLEDGGVQAALALWGDELLTGLEDEWVYERREELRQRLSETLGPAASEAEAMGDLQSAVLLTRRQVALDPLAEEPVRELIRRLACAGDRAAASATYDKLVRRLHGQLGTVPSAATRELAASVRADAAQAGRADSKSNPRSAAATPAAQAIAAAGHRRRVRFRLPLAAAHFTGRDRELDAIDGALGVADRAVVTQAFTGLGGVGKSQLAVRYVRQRADDYDVVAWIRAEDGGTMDLSELAAELGLPVAQLTPAERAGAAVRWLSGCDERWLLVLDNVAAPEQLLDRYPSAGNGRIIVTTRDRRLAQFGPELRVDVFDEATGVEYLLATSGRAEDRDSATRLARALGFLPLALSHAGAYCAAGTSFADYLELLGALPAAGLFDSHPETSYAQSVGSTWQISIQAAERQARLAHQVLAMAAHLAPDAIPRVLFEVLLDDASSAIARKPLLDAFNVLHRLSLVEVHDDAVSVHRLLQKVIRDDPVVRTDKAVVLNTLAAVSAAFPTDHDRPEIWPQTERLVPHALAIDVALTGRGEENQQLVALLNSVSEYLLRAEAGKRAVDAATRASACALAVLGPEHPDTLRARANLAVSYHAVGRPGESIELGARVLADCERILGPEHPNTLTAARGILSVSYDLAWRVGATVEHRERVLASCERILGSEHPDTLRAGMVLALSFREAGRSTEAVELGERVLADCERILGPEHPDTLRAGMNTAFAYREAGRNMEAVEFGERAFADCQRIFGPEHPETLRAGMVLAWAYQGAGRSTEAVELGERVFADCEPILGPEHPNTLRAGLILAASYRAARRDTEAVELGEGLLPGCERIFGSEHLDTLRAGMVLAASYHGARRGTEAVELGERVLADYERILGSEHLDTLRAGMVLAASYHGAGCIGQAIQLGERVLVDCERILGSEHPDMLRARMVLAASYHEAGRTDEAIELAERALADCEPILGAEHPDTLRARGRLVRLYRAVGRSTKAIEQSARRDSSALGEEGIRP
jgi:DNA-binding SARP family transcriptional activator